MTTNYLSSLLVLSLFAAACGSDSDSSDDGGSGNAGSAGSTAGQGGQAGSSQAGKSGAAGSGTSGQAGKGGTGGSGTSGQAGNNASGAGQAGSSQAGAAGTGQAGSAQAGTGQAGTGTAGSGQAGSGQAGSGQAGDGQAGDGQAGSGQAGTEAGGTDAGSAGDSGVGGDSSVGGSAGAGGDTGTAGTGQAGSGTAGSGQAGTGTAGSGQAGSGQAGSGQAGSAGSAGSGALGCPVDTNLSNSLSWKGTYPFTLDPQGWSTLTPSVDTRKIYVSNSTGDDTNAGTQNAPVKTLTKAQALLSGNKPDWILLKTGDTWTGSFGQLKSGRGVNEPVVITSYGDPALGRPTLKTTGNGVYVSDKSTVAHIAVVGIHFQYTGAIGPEADAGAGVNWSGTGRDVLIEDCFFEKYGFNISFTGGSGNVIIRRSVLVDSYGGVDTKGGPKHSSGIYLSTQNSLDGTGPILFTDALIEENVLDHNGWIEGGVRIDQNHNTYIQVDTKGVTYRRNISMRGSGYGVQLRHGGVLAGNILANNALASEFGLVEGGDKPWAEGVSGDIVCNVVVGSTDLSKANPRGFGIQVANLNGQAKSSVRYNIIGNETGTNSGRTGLQLDGKKQNGTKMPMVGIHNLEVDHNTLINAENSLQIQGTPGDSLTGITIDQNLFQSPDQPDTLVQLFFTSTTGITWQHNVYSSQAPAKNWFTLSSGDVTFATWTTTNKETNPVSAPAQFVGSMPTLGTYSQSLGQGATVDAFAAKARQQSKASYNEAYTADAVSAYFRQQLKPKANLGATPVGAVP